MMVHERNIEQQRHLLRIVLIYHLAISFCMYLADEKLLNKKALAVKGISFGKNILLFPQG